MKRFLKKWAWFLYVFWARIPEKLLKLYKFLKLDEIVNWVKYLFHAYGVEQFNTLSVKPNLKTLLGLQRKQWLDSTRKGGLRPLTSLWQKTLFFLKNFLLFGAPFARLKKVVYFTILTSTIEIYNPFEKEVLLEFLSRKIRFIERLLGKLETLNGRPWDRKALDTHIEIFRRSSLLQHQMILWMERAVRQQKEPERVKLVKRAFKKGIQPILITQGCSGAYWMRGPEREIVGLFKPFDEEIHAPNNPIGPSMQGALGQRRTRRGVRVGEAGHREVAAFLVDQFFGFGIVPKTYYASFTHHVFYDAREDRFAGRMKNKTKFGSFQEFIEGFASLEKVPEEELKAISLEEFQLLVVLDVILGNTDRNQGNILIGTDKLAAIDHGLIFGDVPERLSNWYWSFFEQGKEPLFPSLMELLLNFPHERLGQKLHKRCFLQVPHLRRMKERITLFTKGLQVGHSLPELRELMKVENLYKLVDLDASLDATANEIVAGFTPGEDEL